MYQLSFRDPSGSVFNSEKKIFRLINNDKINFYKNLFDQKWYKELVKQGKIQKTKIIESSQIDKKIKKKIGIKKFTLCEHIPFEFPIFVHEMCSQQLYESALLTIELAIRAFSQGIIIKDASAWNVVFDGPKPMFVDVSSFERWDNEKTWFAYGQFCRHFIIPLILSKKINFKISESYLYNRDGIDPKFGNKMLGLKALANLYSIETIILPMIFSKKDIVIKNYNKIDKNNSLNYKIFLGTLNRLKKYVKSLKPDNTSSVWKNYSHQREHYSAEDLKIKKNFLEDILKKIKGNVLDLGCNIGEYSRIAARNLNVVASDEDEICLNVLQQNINNENITVCKLNISQPTPSIGWKNNEQQSFLKRAKEKFDLVMCLGLIHHLLVKERVPLDEIISLISFLTKGYAIIEYIDVNDPKFKKISRFNRNLYTYITADIFETALKKNFFVLKKKKFIYAKRELFFLKKKQI